MTVLSPEGISWVGRAEQLIAPGSMGEFTVLPAHIPMVSLLTAGSVRIFEKRDRAPHRLEVSRGLCSIMPEEVMILIPSDLPAYTKEEATDAF